jgi:hypothetical protein
MLLHTTSSFFDREFSDYLSLGWDHIIDVKAYDHLLFVMTLCALFTYREWRKILVIITAFTIGHSLTLALSTLNWVLLPQEWIEVMIPLTIIITAIANILHRDRDVHSTTFTREMMISYSIALFFGLIHGLGFASNFKFMLGEEGSIVKQLFAFNSGLELGQIAVVLSFMGLQFILSKLFNIAQREWTLFISGAGAGIALTLMLNVLTQ